MVSYHVEQSLPVCNKRLGVSASAIRLFKKFILHHHRNCTCSRVVALWFKECLSILMYIAANIEDITFMFISCLLRAKEGQHKNNIFTNYCIATFFYSHYYKMHPNGTCDSTCKDTMLCALQSSTFGDQTYCSNLTKTSSEEMHKRQLSLRKVCQLAYCKKTALGAETITN